MRAQSAAALLREAVSAGEYAPGTKLNEVAVAERLGVSRNTLREGFATLAADGILDRIPNRGVFISSPTADDVRDLFRARAVVEPGALLWGASPDTDALDHTVTAAESSLATGDTGRTATANQSFHRLIVNSAGSTLLDDEMDRLLARMRLVFLSVEQTRPTLHSDFVPVNRRIVTLLQTGDRSGAAEALRVSLVETGDALAGTLQR